MGHSTCSYSWKLSSSSWYGVCFLRHGCDTAPATASGMAAPVGTRDLKALVLQCQWCQSTGLEVGAVMGSVQPSVALTHRTDRSVWNVVGCEVSYKSVLSLMTCDLCFSLCLIL